ncbi:MAG: ribosome maturation factor RimM, partial [Vicinamibacterales bacterium]
MNWDDGILVGVIARTHGNRGEVIVNPETDFPEVRFRMGARLWTRRRDGAPATLEVV